MGRKCLFFDVDGTIWTGKNYVPESTKTAMRLLKENGHLTFINSGRARGFLFHPNLINLDFDGIVSGCGTMIEYHGNIVFLKEMEIELLRWAMSICREYGFGPILEGKDNLYMNYEGFPETLYADKIKNELGERLLGLDEHEGRWKACKFSVYSGVPGRDEAYERLREHFHVIEHTDTVAELVPYGYSKGKGIERTCELLGIDLKDTYAFGDSTNDLEMLETAAVGICMGDGFDNAKAAADYITTDLLDDGIYNACKHFGLI